MALNHFFAALILLLPLTAATAEEEGGEHEAKKPPPKPPVGSAMSEVLKLPVVAGWTKWVASYKGGSLDIWGESLGTVEEHKCWGVAVGEAPLVGKKRVWRRFCVPVDGSEIWVESKPVNPDDDVTYMLYGKWVEKCAPTETSEGKC